MSLSLNDNIQNNSAKALDNKYLASGTTTYASVAAANAAVVGAYRHKGLKVLINVGGVSTEYWWKDGVSDGDLVPFIETLVVTNGTSTADRAQLASAPNQLTLAVKSIGFTGSGGIVLTRTSTSTTEDWNVDASALVAFSSGTYANRPLTAVLGQQYYQTDLLEGLYTWDGLTWVFQADDNTHILCKFLGSASPMTTNTSGTGATCAQDGTAGFSFWKMSTGTTSTGTASLLTAQDISFGGSTGKTIFYMKDVYIPTISDSSNRFIARMGRPTGTDGIGMFFKYTDNVNSGKIQCITHNGTSATTSDSGVTLVAGTKYTFIAVHDFTGVDNVKFYINNTLVATHTATLPADFIGGYFGSISLEKTVGSTARTMLIDDLIIKRIP